MYWIDTDRSIRARVEGQESPVVLKFTRRQTYCISIHPHTCCFLLLFFFLCLFLSLLSSTNTASLSIWFRQGQSTVLIGSHSNRVCVAALGAFVHCLLRWGSYKSSGLTNSSRFPQTSSRPRNLEPLQWFRS